MLLRQPTRFSSWGILVGILQGGVPLGSPNRDPFRTKSAIFHTHLQIRPLKSVPVFRPILWWEIMSLLRSDHKQNNSSNPFQICIFIFFSYSFGIETINTFIHSCSSLENHTWFQTKMGKIYTHFQTQKAQKACPLGWCISIWLI